MASEIGEHVGLLADTMGDHSAKLSEQLGAMEELTNAAATRASQADAIVRFLSRTGALIDELILSIDGDTEKIGTTSKSLGKTRDEELSTIREINAALEGTHNQTAIEGIAQADKSLTYLGSGTEELSKAGDESKTSVGALRKLRDATSNLIVAAAGTRAVVIEIGAREITAIDDIRTAANAAMESGEHLSEYGNKL